MCWSAFFVCGVDSRHGEACRRDHHFGSGDNAGRLAPRLGRATVLHASVAGATLRREPPRYCGTRRSGTGSAVLALVFASVGDGLVPALTAASGDSSSEHDHSPGSRPHGLGTRHRRPCRAPTGADSSLRFRQRRHSTPGLRAGRNRSIRNGRAAPLVVGETETGPAPGRGEMGVR